MNSEKSITLRRDCDAIEIPSGAHRTLPAGTGVRIMQSLGGSYSVTTDIGAMYRIDAQNSDALGLAVPQEAQNLPDRKSTRLNSSHMSISYAVFCLKKK